MKRLGLAAILLAVLLVALGAGGDARYWHRYWVEVTGGGAQSVARALQPRLRIAGTVAEVPRGSAESELIAPQALTAASDAARLRGMRALLVNRHGHRVLEYFAVGQGGRDLVAGGELSGLIHALALGPLVDARRIEIETALQMLRGGALPAGTWQNPWSAAARQRFRLAAPPPLLRQDADGDIATTLSQRVWLPLQAGDAWLWGSSDEQLRLDCCVVAALDDWMRLGDLLLQQGSYQGERVVSPQWIRHLLNTDSQGVTHPVWLPAQQPWTGDEPPAARDTFWFDLGPDLRLWLVPRRALAVMVWADGADVRDTLLPNTIIRGLLDQAALPSGATDLNDLVPGH